MLFLRNNINNLQKKPNNKKRSSLPKDPHTYPLTAAMEFQGALERAALCICQKKQGSLTVETAVILPLFLFLCFCMVFFIQVTAIHGEVQGGLYQAVREVSENMPLYQGTEDEVPGGKEALNFLSILLVRQKVLDYTQAGLENKVCLPGGNGSLQFACTTVRDDIVDVVVNYQVRLPYAFGLDASFPIVQRCRMRAWTGISGKDDAGPNGEKVYITESGTVYHKSAGCTHLKLSIRSISAQGLEAARNNSGGRYKACEKCAKEGLTGERVYITGEGDRYHNSISCSGLKRSVRQVDKSKVEGMHACTRCCN